MEGISFKLDVSIDDRTGRPRAAYLRVREGQVAETREVSPGRALADYGADGKLLGIEFLAPCSVAVLDDLTADEPEPVKEFFRSSAPRTLVCS